LVGSLGLSCRYNRLLFCLGCSSRPRTKYFFPHRTLFQCLCTHRPASWAGSFAWSSDSSYVSVELNKWSENSKEDPVFPLSCVVSCVLSLLSVAGRSFAWVVKPIPTTAKERGLLYLFFTANEGPVRIQYKCLVPSFVFPEMKLLFPN
jgi:hypothetical protein